MRKYCSVLTPASCPSENSRWRAGKRFVPFGSVWKTASGWAERSLLSIVAICDVYPSEVASYIPLAALSVGGGGDHIVSSGSSSGINRWDSYFLYEGSYIRSRAEDGKSHPVR